MFDANKLKLVINSTKFVFNKSPNKTKGILLDIFYKVLIEIIACNISNESEKYAEFLKMLKFSMEFIAFEASTANRGQCKARGAQIKESR